MWISGRATNPTRRTVTRELHDVAGGLELVATDWRRELGIREQNAPLVDTRRKRNIAICIIS